MPRHHRSNLLRLIGDSFTKLGDGEAGKNAYIQAIDLDPYSAKSFIGLGTVGAEVVRLIESQSRALSARCGRGVKVVAVCARSKVKKRGLDLRGIDWAKNPLALANDAMTNGETKAYMKADTQDGMIVQVGISVQSKEHEKVVNKQKIPDKMI